MTPVYAVLSLTEKLHQAQRPKSNTLACLGSHLCCLWHDRG